jgi:hypothetical protein
MSIFGQNLGKKPVEHVFLKFKSITLSYMEEVVVRMKVRIRATH